MRPSILSRDARPSAPVARHPCARAGARTRPPRRRRTAERLPPRRARRPRTQVRMRALLSLPDSTARCVRRVWLRAAPCLWRRATKFVRRGARRPSHSPASRARADPCPSMRAPSARATAFRRPAGSPSRPRSRAAARLPRRVRPVRCRPRPCAAPARARARASASPGPSPIQTGSTSAIRIASARPDSSR